MSTINDTVNNYFIEKFGMSYDEFERMDFDKQQELINEYHKKNPPKKSKNSIVMIGGGDESIFMRVPKGEKIRTTNGYYIAGESREEYKNRWEQKIRKLKLDEGINENPKIDLKTLLFLHKMHFVITPHPSVEKVENKRKVVIRDYPKNEVYVFKNYEEYRNYFLMYLDNIYDEVIDMAICTYGRKGQVVALKGLCRHILVKSKINEFYKAITKEQIDEIHAKGKLTPLEAVQMWEANNLCIEASQGIMEKGRCHFFDYNCHDCLMESASHHMEYEPIVKKKILK